MIDNLNSSNNTSSQTIENCKILVAEDNDSNFLLVNAILKKCGEISRANNGEEATQMVKANNYDIVLMDIRMPIMDGLEATRSIRSFNPTIPIVALTANAFDRDRIEALDAGCNDFLTKPLKRQDLMDTIAKYTL